MCLFLFFHYFFFFSFWVKTMIWINNLLKFILIASHLRLLISLVGMCGLTIDKNKLYIPLTLYQGLIFKFTTNNFATEFVDHGPVVQFLSESFHQKKSSFLKMKGFIIFFMAGCKAVLLWKWLTKMANIIYFNLVFCIAFLSRK